MKVDLLLKNAEIFNGEGLYRGCLGISKGKIVSLGQNNVTGVEELDVKGAWILPGGIETHAHIREPELTQRGDFASESIAAAAGGITIFLKCPFPLHPRQLWKFFISVNKSPLKSHALILRFTVPLRAAYKIFTSSHRQA
ncbi:hypothetical protein RAH42_01870 [Pyramidobacter sp. YE332]|uniref:hypothetical protein n=1 Tax=Pyramidobacter sp. YE332 TaxID=3068894 RepID=UPI00294B30E8|nr:hypothetical protein [Pyramidobacter sp. YE332]WOL40398.1 hypothetical protein RAH42_01870 [Pyramidobacter sp. YE332]